MSTLTRLTVSVAGTTVSTDASWSVPNTRGCTLCRDEEVVRREAHRAREGITISVEGVHELADATIACFLRELRVFHRRHVVLGRDFAKVSDERNPVADADPA